MSASPEPEAGPSRRLPNILITGTPGTGKTTHAALLAEEYVPVVQGRDESGARLRHLGVGDFVKEKGCHEGWDDEWESWTVDEDKVRRRSLPGRSFTSTD